MRKFFKVEMGGADGWGLLVNEGSVEEPKFRVVLKGSERWMERLAAEMNNGNPEATAALGSSFAKASEGSRHD